MDFKSNPLGEEFVFTNPNAKVNLLFSNFDYSGIVLLRRKFLFLMIYIKLFKIDISINCNLQK